MKLIKQIWELLGTRGTHIPHAYDPTTNTASIRLLFAYISFWIAALSVIALHKFSGLLQATLTAISFFVICTVLYMLRSLHSFKADLDDKSIELESEAEKSSEAEKKD